MAAPQGQTPGSSSSLPAQSDTNAAPPPAVFGPAEAATVAGAAALVAAAMADPARAATLYADLAAHARAQAAKAAALAAPHAARAVGPATRAGAAAGAVQVAAAQALGGWSPPPGYEVAHDANTARILAQELAATLAGAARTIPRFADDAYAAATLGGALSGVVDLPGRLSPAEAQARAWADLTSKGVAGFTDRAGRRWNLASYVEMAVRTATQQAYNASHLDRMTRAGLAYFTISATARPCPLCGPWEGKVLTVTGGAGVATEPHSAGEGGPVTFHVDATLAEAEAAGLMHPNCRHTLVPFLPGVTRLTASTWGDADEAKYRATQRLRYLERRVRAARLQLAGALTPAQESEARSLVRTRAAAARAFADGHGLVNRPRRQRIDLGNQQHGTTTQGARTA